MRTGALRRAISVQFLALTLVLGGIGSLVSLYLVPVVLRDGPLDLFIIVPSALAMVGGAGLFLRSEVAYAMSACVLIYWAILGVGYTSCAGVLDIYLALQRNDPTLAPKPQDWGSLIASIAMTAYYFWMYSTLRRPEMTTAPTQGR